MLRLAVVSPYPPEISGVGQYGRNLVARLAGSGAFESVTVIAPRVGCAVSFEENGPIRVNRVWAKDDPRAVGQILRALLAARPDVVWFNLGFTVFGQSRAPNLMGFATPSLVRALGMPCVVTLHEIIESARLSDIGAVNGRVTHWGAQAATRLALRANLVCLTLNHYVQEISRRYGARNVLHLPLGTYSAPELMPFDEARRELLTFATFAPYKGLPHLLEAYRQLRADDPDLTLAVAGGDHPRFPGYLQQVRQEAGEMEGVRWLGWVEESRLRSVFGQASIVVLPYTATTGSSSVIHRAAGLGRPIVASDLPDIRRLAEEEGLWLEWVPPADPTALAGALRELLADEPRRRAMAERNLAAVRSMTIDDTCRQYTRIFHAIANGGSGL